MSEQQKQISKLAGALTEHQHHFGALSTEDRQWAIQNTAAAIGLFATAVKNRAKEVTTALLAFITTADVLEVAEFRAKDKFREGKETDGVKIWSLGDNFKQNFLGKVERGVPQTTLRINKLEKNSLDVPILAELGDTAETFLANLWELLKKQGRGQAGKLLVNGWWNVFYIRDENGMLFAVDADWCSDGDGWCVEARSVDRPREWPAGRRVVSR